MELNSTIKQFKTKNSKIYKREITNKNLQDVTKSFKLYCCIVAKLNNDSFF